MENLSQLYYDVRIAKIQLEYMLEIARAALQPWPMRDLHGQVHVQNKQTATEENGKDTQSHKLSLDDDMKLLDEILAKAQTARHSSQTSKRQRKVNIVKTLTPYMESSTSRTAVQSKSAAKMSRAFSVNKTMGGAQSVDKPDATDQFTVEKHGNKITLPSKWSQMRTAADKLADDKMEPLCRMEGQHFVQLLRQQGDNDYHINHLLIIKAALDAMIDDVASIPTEHWTINSRNTWKALFRVEHHLDIVQQSMVILKERMDKIPSSHSSSSAGLPLFSKHHLSQQHLTYSSFKELLDYVEAHITLQLRLFQLKIIQLCQHHLVPTVCGVSTTTNDTASITTNIRNIYNLIGLKCSPVFLHVTNNS